MTTSYFTFGQTHVHSVGGFTYDKDIVVKITAENPRQIMFDTFRDKWAMQYDKVHDNFMAFFPRGLKELSVLSENLENTEGKGAL